MNSLHIRKMQLDCKKWRWKFKLSDMELSKMLIFELYEKTYKKMTEENFWKKNAGHNINISTFYSNSKLSKYAP